MLHLVLCETCRCSIAGGLLVSFLQLRKIHNITSVLESVTRNESIKTREASDNNSDLFSWWFNTWPVWRSNVWRGSQFIKSWRSVLKMCVNWGVFTSWPQPVVSESINGFHDTPPPAPWVWWTPPASTDRPPPSWPRVVSPVELWTPVVWY